MAVTMMARMIKNNDDIGMVIVMIMIMMIMMKT